MNKLHPKHQWSIFAGAKRNEQYVVRCDDFEELKEGRDKVLDFIEKEELREEKEKELPF